MKGSRIDSETRKNMKIHKVCGCGHVHTQLPEETVMDRDGLFYWFDCVCKSTLTWKTSQAETKMKEIRSEIQDFFSRQMNSIKGE